MLRSEFSDRAFDSYIRAFFTSHSAECLVHSLYLASCDTDFDGIDYERLNRLARFASDLNDLDADI